MKNSEGANYLACAHGSDGTGEFGERFFPHPLKIRSSLNKLG